MYQRRYIDLTGLLDGCRLRRQPLPIQAYVVHLLQQSNILLASHHLIG